MFYPTAYTFPDLEKHITGTRRSLFSPSSKDKEELQLQNDLLAEKAIAEEPAAAVQCITEEKIDEFTTEGRADEVAAVTTEGKVDEVIAEEKASEPIIHKTKRTAAGAKPGKDGKKQKA